ncbi:MAG TPA: ribosome maturation factor RimM [Gammaproteobacteria bacterium]|nr:ribosome maturation factor RimM [Gammaproteobacteria bacterium]
MKKDSHMVVVGRLGRAYGVQGWLKLHSFTEPAENILSYQHWFIRNKTGAWEPASLEHTRIQDQSLLVKLTGCSTPEQAQVYVNADIAVTRDQLPKLTTGNYYWSDLEGLKVINQQGIELGTVTRLMATGANDVLVVKGEKERLLPYIKQVVLAVDLQQGVMRVDWDENF